MIRFLMRLRSEEKGQDLIEYALLASLVAMASVAALNMLGPVIASFYESLVPHFG